MTNTHLNVDIPNWRKELGHQLRQARKDLFLRQEDLRKRVGIHINMIGRYENGEAAPDLDVLINLAKALEIQEIKIGTSRIQIAQDGEVRASTPGKQLRLEFGKEYIFDNETSSVKIQPRREGLLITPDRREASA